MADLTQIQNNSVRIVKNDEIVLDSSRPSVQLFADNTRIIRNGFQISFPSPIQWRAYYRSANGGITKCELWSTLIWQEWGPTLGTHNERFYGATGVQDRPGPTTRNLAEQLLGTVPAGTDYIDVRVRLRRTKTSANFSGISPPVPFFPLNEWVTSPGGSFPTEYFFPLARHFDIVMSGTNVYLRRYQSTKNADNRNAPGNNPQRDLRTQSGWQSNGFTNQGSPSDGTPGSELAPKSNFYLGGLIQIKNYSADGTKRPNGSNPCVGNFPDFQSIYSADIIVTPGRYLAAI